METITLADAPERVEEVERLNDSSWPEFMLHGDVRGWSKINSVFAEFQILVIEEGRLLGAGMTIPSSWRPGMHLPKTIDEIVFNAEWPLPDNKEVLCALAALVTPSARGRGLSKLLIQAMMKLAAKHGLSGVIAPVRPTRKHELPFEPITDYCNRRDQSGRLWDPWLRVHEELGGKFLGIMETALTVRASVTHWEK